MMDAKMRGLVKKAKSNIGNGVQKAVDTVGAVVPGSTGVSKAIQKARGKEPVAKAMPFRKIDKMAPVPMMANPSLMSKKPKKLNPMPTKVKKASRYKVHEM